MRTIDKLKFILKWITLTCGSCFIILCFFAFTRVPYDIHRWLGENSASFKFTPETIVMLGGSGMPSESNLIRLYYTNEISNLYPDANIIIAHPIDAAVAGSMKNYLVNAGIDSTRISLMLKGTNTREQALELLKFRIGIENTRIAIITSPENMFRTLRVFRKLNFKHTGGIATFENAMFVNLNYNHKKVGGSAYVPSVSSNLDLRYNFWNYFKLEITCTREGVALLYYKINGWI
jgi:uncharacterized SAM-binding protein YcdF (DUF218 family)